MGRHEAHGGWRGQRAVQRVWLSMTTRPEERRPGRDPRSVAKRGPRVSMSGLGRRLVAIPDRGGWARTKSVVMALRKETDFCRTLGV